MEEPVTLESAVQKANDLRARILVGDFPDKEELRAALDNLRSGRSAAATTKKAAAKNVQPMDLSALFTTPVKEE